MKHAEGPRRDRMKKAEEDWLKKKRPMIDQIYKREKEKTSYLLHATLYRP
jgi:hypothetical protein